MGSSDFENLFEMMVMNEESFSNFTVVSQQDFAVLRDLGPLFNADFGSILWLKVS